MFSSVSPLITKRTRFMSSYEPKEPGDLLASLQFISHQVKGKKATADHFELTRHELSRITDKNKDQFGGYLGEDGSNYRGPNALMFHFFQNQFKEIAPVDGNEASISVYDLVLVNPKLVEKNEKAWGDLLNDVKGLVEEFQFLLTRANKENGELTLADFDTVAKPSPWPSWLGGPSDEENNNAKAKAEFWRHNFAQIASVSGENQVITIKDLVVRHPDCPDEYRPNPPKQV